MLEQDWDTKLQEYERQLAYLPPATSSPCNDCPWRRNAIAGWLGPHTASEWLDIAHGESAIACHQTIDHNGQDWSELKQCRGAAIFRANVAKLPRNPKVAVGPEDHEHVFSSSKEFLEHHEKLVN